jgi:hypothetical protein
LLQCVKTRLALSDVSLRRADLVAIGAIADTPRAQDRLITLSSTTSSQDSGLFGYAARATVTLFRGPERRSFSRHEAREQADEPRWAPLPLKSET